MQAVIFDLDGTMIDSMPTHKKSWGLLMAEYQLSVDLDDFMKVTTGKTGRECMRTLFNSGLSDAEADFFIEKKEHLYRELFRTSFQEIQGFKTFLDLLINAGVFVAIGTATNRDNVVFSLDELGLSQDVFHSIVCGVDVTKGKPEPDIFLEASRRMGVLPENCLVFEDSLYGIEAAMRANMKAVAITSTHAEQDFLSWPHVLKVVPDYSTTTPEELRSLIQPLSN